ncbi:hypothetical protein GCM10010441_13830 [Kitasatospora paracochleata]|uniref:Uncharacterized protein n=1 Tax=Kitasatospora paracochleata TaxID=58354 RepID=A0ABT1JAQ3_9ACTN|nr:hypothetical protein [Kitasatospora paracochleata]MCP2314520.1 hypothetical protein [Kitasatospora paracochleata]
MHGTTRAIHRCDADVTTAVDGFTDAPDPAAGISPAVTVTYCADHLARSRPWHRLHTVERASDPAEGRCGWASDFRGPRTGYQDHADGWLNDLSGIDRADHATWAAYLTALHRELCARYGLDPAQIGGGAIGWIGLTAAEATAMPDHHEGAAIFLVDAEILAIMGLVEDAPEQCC